MIMMGMVKIIKDLTLTTNLLPAQMDISQIIFHGQVAIHKQILNHHQMVTNHEAQAFKELILDR